MVSSKLCTWLNVLFASYFRLASFPKSIHNDPAITHINQPACSPLGQIFSSTILWWFYEQYVHNQHANIWEPHQLLVNYTNFWTSNYELGPFTEEEQNLLICATRSIIYINQQDLPKEVNFAARIVSPHQLMLSSTSHCTCTYNFLQSSTTLFEKCFTDITFNASFFKILKKVVKAICVR